MKLCHELAVAAAWALVLGTATGVPMGLNGARGETGGLGNQSPFCASSSDADSGAHCRSASQVIDHEDNSHSVGAGRDASLAEPLAAGANDASAPNLPLSSSELAQPVLEPFPAPEYVDQYSDFEPFRMELTEDDEETMKLHKTWHENPYVPESAKDSCSDDDDEDQSRKKGKESEKKQQLDSEEKQVLGSEVLAVPENDVSETQQLGIYRQGRLSDAIVINSPIPRTSPVIKPFPSSLDESTLGRMESLDLVLKPGKPKKKGKLISNSVNIKHRFIIPNDNGKITITQPPKREGCKQEVSDVKFY